MSERPYDPIGGFILVLMFLTFLAWVSLLVALR